MNGQFTQEILSGLSRTVRIRNGLAVLLMTICVSGIGTGIGQALGSEALTTTTSASGADRLSIMAGAGKIHFASTPSPAMADPCLPLLNAIRQPSNLAMDRTRRSAGHQQKLVPAVAIGFYLGLRHAPGPTESLKDDINRRSAGDSHALAVSQYRTCRRELELRSLG